MSGRLSPSAGFSELNKGQSGTVITWTHLSWYYTQHCNGSSRTSIRIQILERHQISRHCGRATGCKLWGNCLRCNALHFMKFMMTSFSALLTLCAGNLPVKVEFPSQRPVARSFDVFFDLCLNKQLNKQSRHRWFETQLRSLWRHCNFYLQALLARVRCKSARKSSMRIHSSVNSRWNLRVLMSTGSTSWKKISDWALAAWENEGTGLILG